MSRTVRLGVAIIVSCSAATAPISAQAVDERLSHRDAIATVDLVLTEVLDSVAKHAPALPRVVVPDSLGPAEERWWRAQLAARRIRGLCGGIDQGCRRGGWRVYIRRPEQAGDSVRVSVSWWHHTGPGPSLDDPELVMRQWEAGLLRPPPAAWEPSVDRLDPPRATFMRYVLARAQRGWTVACRETRGHSVSRPDAGCYRGQ